MLQFGLNKIFFKRNLRYKHLLDPIEIKSMPILQVNILFYNIQGDPPP